MQFVQLSSIAILENRQRRTFDPSAITELADSIQSHGVFHPPVVRPALPSEAPYLYALVAGERRLRAMTELLSIGATIECDGKEGAQDEVPVTLIKDLSPLELREAELEENTRRVDLSWQELATATAELHALRAEQAALSGNTHTYQDTAAEILGKTKGKDSLGATPSKVAASVILSRHMADPEVAKAKTEKEAMKVVERKLQKEHFRKLAENFDLQNTACPHTLMQGSMLERSCELPSNTFQVLLTDPPYGIDADSFGEQSGTGHNYSDSEEYFNELTQFLAVEAYRVCTEQAHAYVFCDPRRFAFIEQQFTLAGWDVWPIPLIWKKSTGMLPRPEHAPRRTYEMILYAIKGNKRVLQVKGDVIDVPSVRDLKHGAQKPVALYTDLLSRSCSPGDKVIDFFAGSGTIFPAANAMKLIATGIELSSDNANICRLRMEESADELSDIQL